MPLAQSNGVNLYYELNGDHGDPMVLIHGSWTDHSAWNLVVPNLASNFRVLSYDRRGHGQSEKVKTQGSGEEDAADLAALLVHLGLSPAHVVGNSSGGSVALKMAVGQPSVLRSVNVHEPPLWDLLAHNPLYTPALNEGDRRRAEVARVLESGDRAAAAKLFIDTLVFGPGTWDRMRESSRETMIANADTWLDEIKDPKFAAIDVDALGRFTKPALLTYGGRDMQKGPKLVIDRLAEALNNSKVQVFSNDGHAPHTTNPAEFVRVVTSFAQSAR